jgi:hypothetical protein
MMIGYRKDEGLKYAQMFGRCAGSLRLSLQRRERFLEPCAASQ